MRPQAHGLINGVVGIENVKDADLVIEAVFETMAIRRNVREARQVLQNRARCWLPTPPISTSTRSPSDKAPAACWHALLLTGECDEAVRDRAREKTAPGRAGDRGRRRPQIAKVPAVVGVCDGFVGNRMLHHAGKQSEKLLFEGALPQQVDAVVTKFGMRWDRSR